jgi:hypothetical protein
MARPLRCARPICGDLEALDALVDNHAAGELLVIVTEILTGAAAAGPSGRTHLLDPCVA